MNTKEQVTTFSLEEPGTGKQVPVSALIKAINAHCREQLKGESFCDTTAWDSLRKDERVPESGRSYPLANVLPQTKPEKRRRGLTNLQRLGILLAMLFLLYLAW